MIICRYGDIVPIEVVSSSMKEFVVPVPYSTGRAVGLLVALRDILRTRHHVDFCPWTTCLVEVFLPIIKGVGASDGLTKVGYAFECLSALVTRNRPPSAILTGILVACSTAIRCAQAGPVMIQASELVCNVMAITDRPELQEPVRSTLLPAIRDGCLTGALQNSKCGRAATTRMMSCIVSAPFAGKHLLYMCHI